MKWVLSIGGVLLIILIATNPFVLALFGLLDRKSEAAALALNGVESCPAITLRHAGSGPTVRKGTPAKVDTVADRWSKPVAVRNDDLRLHGWAYFWHDHAVGLCVLYELPSGEFEVVYIPDRFHRDGWKPYIVPFAKVSFASPEGLQKIGVAYTGDVPDLVDP